MAIENGKAKFGKVQAEKDKAQEEWEKIYDMFLQIGEKYEPDKKKIKEEVDKLYDKHNDDATWTLAYMRWLDGYDKKGDKKSK